jgi:hypothetical protein
MKQWLCGYLLLTVLTVSFVVPAAGRGEVSIADSTLAEFNVCYATLGNNDANAGALVKIDVVTGAGTLVGPTGITGEFGDPGVPALAVTFTGEIYATDIGSSSNLYVIDATTGTATLVGATGLSSPPAIAFNGNDVLYAIDISGDLYTVDHATGVATFVAATGVFFKGLAFDPTTAVLWGCDASGFIYTIDEDTGTTTIIGNTILPPSPDICFDTGGALFASSGGGISVNNLVSIDKSTGAGTVIGSIGFSAVSGMGMRLDRLSPVAVVAYETRWVESSVEVAWRLVGVEGALSFDITRVSDRDGAVQTVRDAHVARRGNEYIFEDRSAEPGNSYHYRVDVHEDGVPITSFETSIATPTNRFALEQNHPNPFNPATSISFSIERDQHVSLTVYDIAGRLVATLADRAMSAGKYTERWDGRDRSGNPAATGVYFFRLTAGTRTLTRKAVLLK